MKIQKHSELNLVPSFGEVSAPTVLASQGQRFGTMLLDLIFAFILGVVLSTVFFLIGLGNIIENINDNLLCIILSLIYYIPQETFSGRTLGKLITGTKAVKEDGTELSFGHALGRTLCRFIPFEAFSFFGGNGRPRGWHDKIPKTKVISVRRKSVGINNGGTMVEQKHSGIGIASLITSIVSGILIFLLMATAVVMNTSTPGGIDEKSAGAIIVGLTFFVFLGTLLVALGLGIAGLVQKERKKIFAIIGTVFSAGLLVFMIFIIILGH